MPRAGGNIRGWATAPDRGATIFNRNKGETSAFQIAKMNIPIFLSKKKRTTCLTRPYSLAKYNHIVFLYICLFMTSPVFAQYTPKPQTVARERRTPISPLIPPPAVVKAKGEILVKKLKLLGKYRLFIDGEANIYFPGCDWDEGEVVDMANDDAYGLGGAVWTRTTRPRRRRGLRERLDFLIYIAGVKKGRSSVVNRFSGFGLRSSPWPECARRSTKSCPHRPCNAWRRRRGCPLAACRVRRGCLARAASG